VADLVARGGGFASVTATHVKPIAEQVSPTKPVNEKKRSRAKAARDGSGSGRQHPRYQHVPPGSALPLHSVLDQRRPLQLTHADVLEVEGLGEPAKQGLATAEDHRRDDGRELVDDTGVEALADHARAAAHGDVLVPGTSRARSIASSNPLTKLNSPPPLKALLAVGRDRLRPCRARRSL
jgi:hypothetical protein